MLLLEGVGTMFKLFPSKAREPGRTIDLLMQFCKLAKDRLASFDGIGGMVNDGKRVIHGVPEGQARRRNRKGG